MYLIVEGFLVLAFTASAHGNCQVRVSTSSKHSFDRSSGGVIDLSQDDSTLAHRSFETSTTTIMDPILCVEQGSMDRSGTGPTMNFQFFETAMEFKIEYNSDLSDDTIQGEGVHGTELLDLMALTDRSIGDRLPAAGEVNMVRNSKTGVVAG